MRRPNMVRTLGSASGDGTLRSTHSARFLSSQRPRGGLQRIGSRPALQDALTLVDNAPVNPLKIAPDPRFISHRAPEPGLALQIQDGLVVP